VTVLDVVEVVGVVVLEGTAGAVVLDDDATTSEVVGLVITIVVLVVVASAAGSRWAMNWRGGAPLALTTP